MSLPEIKIQNTLTNQKEVFEPLVPGKVTLYSCGPTVYDFAHIGNFRSFLMSDVLYRVLTYAGYEVTKVMNITDVGHLTGDDLADADGEDKIAKKALREKKDPFEVAKMFEDAFIEDEEKLNIKAPDHRPRATDFIPEQIELCNILIEKGYAYMVNGSVYFRTAKFPDYGQLSNNKLEDLNAGARVEINDEKEDPLDFALWKHAEPKHLMQWDYHTGEKLDPSQKHPESVSPGFPGWHIECSAMSQKLLGDHFDIHTGGEDNVFPHHECEIAQNECSCGHKSVNYWMHAKYLLVDGEKMSKSKGNFYTVRDLFEKGWDGTEIRYLMLSAHYRSSINFSIQGLEMARSSIARITEARRIFGKLVEETSQAESIDWINTHKQKYQSALYDDLNTADALGAVFELIAEGMKRRDEGKLGSLEAYHLSLFLENDFDAIFDILPPRDANEIPEEIVSRLEQRAKARENKNWEASDRIREEIRSMGYEVLDEDGGQSVKKI